MAAFQAQKHKPGLGQSQDEWTVREKLTLASSVQRSGDQNWVSVSRAIKPINETGCLGRVRPPDFFSQKNCAILYSQMLEKVNTPKRKRTSETGAGETPGEQIIRKLTFERIEELKKSIKNDQLTYRKLKMRIEDIRNGKNDAQLPAVWDEIQARKRRIEELQQMQQSASLQSSGGDSPAIPFPTPPGINFAPGGNSTPVTGLKQTPTQAVTPSPHKGKQLRIPKPTQRFQKYQQQLQQRHGQTGQHGASSGSPVDVNMTSESPRSSIDAPRLSLDEPIKTEPMDIDPGAALKTVTMEMPPVGSGQLVAPTVDPGVINPSQGSVGRRLSSGNTMSQGDSLKILLSQPSKEQTSVAQQEASKKGTEAQQTPNAKPPQDNLTSLPVQASQPLNKQQTTDSKSFLGNRPNPDTNKLDSLRERLSTNTDAPSVTAPTLSKLLSTSSPNNNKTIVNNTSSNAFIEKSLGSKTIESGINNLRSSTGISGSGRGAITVGGKGDEGGGVAVTSISVNPKAAITAGTLPSPMAMTPPPSTPPAEKKEEVITESIVKTIEPVPSQSERNSIEQIQDTKDETDVSASTAEQSLPPEPKIEVVDTPTPSPRVTGRTRAPKPGRPGRPRGRRSQRRSKSVTSTDNETEVEEEKEEDNKSESIEAESEKASEKDEEEDDMESTVSEKKDSDDDEQESIDDGYSESGDRSKEESFLDRSSTIGSESVPASPASQTSQGDMDSEAIQAQKTWRKSIMLVWRAAANHKYANVFLHAVTDDEAPGYHNIVFRPMDLTTIKKNIENGTIRSTSEFQRDMMLMFQNALMYNNSDHDVYRMAEEMRDDVMDQIQSYIATQLMVQSSDRDSTKMLRGHRSDGRSRAKASQQANEKNKKP